MIRQTIYFGNPAELHIKNRQLCITLRSSDSNSEKSPPVTRPLEDIGMVIIDHPGVMLTTSVMTGLMDAGAALLVCGADHLPSGLMLNIEGHCEQSERFRIQHLAPLPLKKQLWQQTVRHKILNQAAIARIVAGAETGNMLAWAKAVKSGDSDNREALAAAYYWRVMFADNPGFSRRRDGCEPNSLLNYGYAVLRATVARSLVAAGLHPSIGIFHRNKYNAYALADDIMEPYRPYIDLTVMEILADTPDASLVDREVKRRLLSAMNRDTVIKSVRRPLSLAVSQTASSLMKCFSRKIPDIDYPLISHDEPQGRPTTQRRKSP